MPMPDAQHIRGSRFPRPVHAVVGVVMGVAVASLPAAAWGMADPVYPPLFGTNEVRSTNLAPFPKWTGVLDRYFAEVDLAQGACGAETFNACHLRDWTRFLEGLRGADAMTQLERVNRYMNRAPYITDPRNYNVDDYWATPRQFFGRDGDCEDYAIAKFMSLRALGWDNDHMRIVVLKDLNLDIAHAVLVVYRDGLAWVLDNQIGEVVAADRIRHYRPYYSINEDSWWLHRP
ncbi:MAG: transglutaminase-like cysteine peptidase [Alphaproteobacteria bacterium]